MKGSTDDMYYILALAWLLLDQVSKHYVQAHFYLGESLPVIPNVFHWTYILNRGAAFGILLDQRIFFLFVVAVLFFALWIYRKKVEYGPSYLKMGVALLVSGALGNGWDRYHIGAVIDFFDFRIWPIFNIADIGICVGVTLICWYLLKMPEVK